MLNAIFQDKLSFILIKIQDDILSSQKPSSSYREGLAKSLEDSSFINVLLWGIAVFGIIIILFLLTIFLKKYYEKRVKSIYVKGIDYKDLDRMKRTGLVSEEEMAKIKKKMAENFLKSSIPGDGSKEIQKILSPEVELAALNKKTTNDDKTAADGKISIDNKPFAPLPVRTQRDVPIVEGSNLKPINFDEIKQHDESSLKMKAQQKKPKKREEIKPLDLDELFANGLISEAELKEFRLLFNEIKSYPKINSQ